MLKKVTLSLILLILLSSCALSMVSAQDIFDETNSLGFISSDSHNQNQNYFAKEINIFDFFPFGEKSVDLYLDGENISVEAYNLGGDIDSDILELEILDFTGKEIYNSSTNITTLKEGIASICSSHGIDDIEVHIDSSIGEDQIPLVFETQGDSMLPTIQSGQSVLVNKTHNIHVGDLVSADSPEYGGICKRVADIEGDSVFLISDNKNVTYEYYEDYYIESKGIRTWVNIDNIDGVIIDIF